MPVPLIKRRRSCHFFNPFYVLVRSLPTLPFLPAASFLSSQRNMLSSWLAPLAIVGTLVGSATAQFSILSPGGPNLWWGTCLSNCVTSS
jgi:hypothetical protein